MSRHGIVELSAVLFEKLICRSVKDDFSEAAFVAALGHGEPVVLASAPAAPAAGPELRLPRRLRVYSPRHRTSAWIWQATEDGTTLVRWVGSEGTVDLTFVRLTVLDGHSEKEEDSRATVKVLELRQGDVVVLEDRRVRVWAPRLDAMGWIWQWATDGTSMVKWLGEPPARGEGLEGLVRVREAGPAVALRGRVGRLLASPPEFSPGSVLVECAPEGTLRRGGDTVTVCEPGSDKRERVLASAVLDVTSPFHKLARLKTDYIPEAVMSSVNVALTQLCGTDGEGSGGAFTPVAMRRDDIWCDIIDPELCMCKPDEAADDDGCGPRFGAAAADKEGVHWAWQAAEADVDEAGAVCWASWVNHLAAEDHPAALQALAELFSVALPLLSEVTGVQLLGRRLQVVVRAYQQTLSGDEATPYRISEWHVDGRPSEHIAATAACYVDLDGTLSGGSVDFVAPSEIFIDEPEAIHNEQPGRGSVLAFNNQTLRHRVNHLAGRGRRRMVAFHLVDPEYRQRPVASSLPRQLSVQQARDLLYILVPMRALPVRVLALIARFTANGDSLEALIKRRRLERALRLGPRPGGRLMRTMTGVFPFGRDDDFHRTLTGTLTGTTYTDTDPGTESDG